MGKGILMGQETRKIKSLETNVDNKISKDTIVVGKKNEIYEKIANDEIPEGAIVHITDDLDTNMYYTRDEVNELLKGYSQRIQTLVDEATIPENAIVYVTDETNTESFYNKTEIDTLISSVACEDSCTNTGQYGTRAEGYYTNASGNWGAHAEGYYTEASGAYAHAEGGHTKASAPVTHAEGWFTAATYNNAHSEGLNTTASGGASHAEGELTLSNGSNSHAQGRGTVSSNCDSFAGGRYNAPMINGAANANVGHAMVIGNGSNNDVRKNALSLMYDGTLKTANTITASTTADYAEYFEWLDGNVSNEDRVGLFVTLDGDKIKIASNEDDYILGIISGAPFVLGNGDCDVWNGMILRDEFRRPILTPAPVYERKWITEPKEITITDTNGKQRTEMFNNITGYEMVPVTDADGNQVYDGMTEKINPKYDSTQEYKSRKDRTEWDAVGMVGVLPVKQDGTLKVNGYATVSNNGIATACDKSVENRYRVIRIVTENIAEVVFR